MVSSTVVPSATNERTTSQTSMRLRGSWPVGRLVEEQHARREDEARREVEPPPHPARVVLGLLARRVGEPEALEQLVGAPPRGPRRRGGTAARTSRGSGGPVSDVVDRVVLAGQADPEADLARRRATRRARPRARRPRRTAAASRRCARPSSFRRRWGRAGRTPCPPARRGRIRRGRPSSRTACAVR